MSRLPPLQEAPSPSVRFESVIVEEDALRLNLLILDGSPLRRACIAVALETAGVRILQQSSLDQPEAGEPPDIILFQTGESELEGAALPLQIAQAKQLWPAAAILVIADHGNEALMQAAIAAGAQALLRSSTGIVSMQRVLFLLKEGLAVYPAALAATLHRRQPDTVDGLTERIAQAVDRFKLLTKRQRDVLRLLAQGASNKDIAQRLNISESTVKVHVRAIMAVNGASNRTQIVAHLLKGGGED
ncbi:helix-turn-helix transcriptional regulator [Sphingobium fuliginis]|jgi:two-component system nitrate/nitrite response regulator NarL|uniref:DNA-binding response regulator, LuxR family n=1 Tax=Sphingobium fuliginis (strain ATCC 27551) TaxID=336203 RepID=A0A292ZBR7_SPHSA|nr:response regulator transcription factor [Sphingobium fuliginis]GAY20294.1 DNA-binding response regulator, LuxR family [Sphingobium fuliginis]